MFIPESFRITDPGVVFPFIEAFGFATLITTTSNGSFMVTPVPLLLDPTTDPPVLTGHFARENSHWRHLGRGRESLAIFHGPHGYISPTWYRHSPAVPTWNYAVVHVYGTTRLVEDPDEARRILDSLVEKYEADRLRPWRSADVPAEYLQQMMKGIVAFRMTVGRVEAKFKLGQNRTAQDRRGMLEGLLTEPSAEAHALAKFACRHAGGKALAE